MSKSSIESQYDAKVEELKALEDELEVTSNHLKKKSLQNKIKGLQKVLGEISIEDIPVEDTRVKPTKWVKVTIEQVLQAQEDHKLCGFDPDKMIALIRD